MRMWKISAKKLCDKHLLGAHCETHMFLGSLHLSLDGYIKRNLVELHNIKQVHDELVEAMLERGFKHKTPILVQPDVYGGEIDAAKSQEDLFARCSRCSEGRRK